MPDTQLTWEQVRDVLIKRRKAGQAPHWCMGWVAARVARTGDALVHEAYQRTVLDYYNGHTSEDEDSVKVRTWHRLIGFVDGLHNTELPEAADAGGAGLAAAGSSGSGVPGSSGGHDAPEEATTFDDDDKTLVMDL